MKNCVVLDIDGVILDSAFIFDEIFEKKLKGDEVWDYFHAHCNGERVKSINSCKGFFGMLYLIKRHTELDIILLTSRNDKVYKETEKKLKEFIYYDKLIMRPDGDYRESHVLKKEALEKLQKEYRILLFIDDELKNCEAAKELGIFSLRKV